MEAEAKIEYANLIKDLRNRKEVLQAKLEELKKASDEAWIEAYLTVREIGRARAQMAWPGASLEVLAGNRFAALG